MEAVRIVGLTSCIRSTGSRWPAPPTDREPRRTRSRSRPGRPGSERRRILAAPTPDRQRRGEQIGAAVFDLLEEAGANSRVSGSSHRASSSQTRKRRARSSETAESVACDGDERGAIERHHAVSLQQSHTRRALSAPRPAYRSQDGTVHIIQNKTGCLASTARPRAACRVRAARRPP